MASEEKSILWVTAYRLYMALQTSKKCTEKK